MKAVAKCLTVLALLAVLALAYVHYASRLIVRYAGVNVASCADYQQTFDTIRDYAQRGTADVTVFTEAPGYNSGDYKFITYTVDVRNLNALGAEWMDLNVTPKQGDLLQVNSKVDRPSRLQQRDYDGHPAVRPQCHRPDPRGDPFLLCLWPLLTKPR